MQKVNNLEAFKRSFKGGDWIVTGHVATKSFSRPHYIPQVFMNCEIMFEPVPREEGEDALYYHVEWYYSNGGLNGNVRNSFIALSLEEVHKMIGDAEAKQAKLHAALLALQD